MLCAYTRFKDQVSVYRTNGPLVSSCFVKKTVFIMNTGPFNVFYILVTSFQYFSTQYYRMNIS